MKKFEKVIFAIFTLVTLFAAMTAAGCANPPENYYNEGYVDSVSYSDGIIANDYEVEIIEADKYRIYQPKANTEWVFIFYLGTMMMIDNYDFILGEIASHGISVVVSDNKFADLNYKSEEKAYTMFNASNYIIGGHSQGGGAAIRRASENADTTKACVLYSAMLADNNTATLADTTLPVIFFEAQKDKILSDSHKSVAKSRMNDECEYVMLAGANHMCYGESDMMSSQDGKLERSKEEIQKEVVEKTVAFLDKVIKNHVTEDKI